MKVLPLFAIASLAAATVAQALTPPLEHPGSVPILLSLDSVRSELKLSPSQRRAIDAIRAGYRTDARAIVASTVDPSSSRHEAHAALTTLRARANQEAAAVLTPSQLKRLREIEFQKLEGTMLTIPHVQSDLRLTPSQIAKIEKGEGRQLRKAEAINRAFEEGRIGPEERISKLRDLRLKTAESFVALLTPAQKHALEQKKGAPFRAD